jgi:hypothetical protein
MTIQDKYNELDLLINTMLSVGTFPDQLKDYWVDIYNWLEKKGFFGKYGYDFKNHCFKTEPDLPGQQYLFQSEKETEQARLQIDEEVTSLEGASNV